MIRVCLGVVLAVGLGSAALAQSSATGSTELTNDPNSSVVQPGIAKPPSDAPKPAHVKRQPTGSSAVWANQPTLPQIALHPTATIGSPVPIAGPGGTTKAVTGQ